jgi:hypothetical protein
MDRYRISTQRLWRDPDKGPWYVELYWTEVNGELVPYGMTLLSDRRPAGEPPGSLLGIPRYRRDPETGAKVVTDGFQTELTPRKLTGEELRGLGFAELAASMADSKREFHRWWAEQEAARRRLIEERGDQWAAASSRAKWTPGELAEIARVHQAGRPRSLQAVIEWYAARTDGETVDESTASRWIRQARDIGMLPDTGRRRKGANR